MRKAIRAGDHQAIREMVDVSCGAMLAEQAAALLSAGRTTEEEIHRVLHAGGS